MIRNYEPSNRMVKKEERFKYFQSAVYGYRKASRTGGGTCSSTPGDAFDYIKINGVPDRFFEDELRLLKRFIVELIIINNQRISKFRQNPSSRMKGTF